MCAYNLCACVCVEGEQGYPIIIILKCQMSVGWVYDVYNSGRLACVMTTCVACVNSTV